MAHTDKAAIGRPPKISREQILDTVLLIGFQEATVSEVARRLDVDQSALYRHVTSRVLMLQDASERAFERYEWPLEAADWRTYLNAFADSLWKFLGSVSGLAVYLASVQHMPRNMTVAALAVTARVTSFGFAPRDAMLVVDCVADMVTQSMILRKTLDSTPDAAAGASLRTRVLESITRTAPDLDDTIGFVAAITEQLTHGDETGWWRAKLALILDGAEHRMQNAKTSPLTAATRL